MKSLAVVLILSAAMWAKSSSEVTVQIVLSDSSAGNAKVIPAIDAPMQQRWLHWRGGTWRIT